MVKGLVYCEKVLGLYLVRKQFLSCVLEFENKSLTRFRMVHMGN